MSALVGVIMGSKSDWSTLSHTADMLEKLGIPHEVTVVSAHRTPARLVDYATNAVARGLKVVFNPFLMMDVPAGNGLPDPRGTGEQPAYPWRGDIAAAIAPWHSPPTGALARRSMTLTSTRTFECG